MTIPNGELIQDCLHNLKHAGLTACILIEEELATEGLPAKLGVHFLDDDPASHAFGENVFQHFVATYKAESATEEPTKIE